MLKKVIKLVLSQKAVNNLYHLPKAILANVLYGFPTRQLKVIGITGTDGKTTTTNMIYGILKDAGKKVSMISTINAVIGPKSYDTGFHVTSPNPFMVQKFANSAKQNGSEYLVLEVTSHALDQYRYWGIKFDIGVITNITHEHLDYHKTFENYKNTKLKLIKNTKYAVVNQNIKLNGTQGKKFTFGIDKGDFNQKDNKLNLKLQVNYNTENALAALAVAFVLGIDKKKALKTSESFDNLKGRMDEVKNKMGIKIIIDFAHTPNGYENVFEALRSQTSGQLISLIGAEGYRDVGKRSLMGEIAQRLSDIVIVTAVDPRGQLETINNQIITGAKRSGAKLDKNLFVIADREQAIDFAINALAKKGDTIAILGKGHELSMNLDGKKEIRWSDYEAAEKALNG